MITRNQLPVTALINVFSYIACPIVVWKCFGKNSEHKIYTTRVEAAVVTWGILTVHLLTENFLKTAEAKEVPLSGESDLEVSE